MNQSLVSTNSDRFIITPAKNISNINKLVAPTDLMCRNHLFIVNLHLNNIFSAESHPASAEDFLTSNNVTDALQFIFISVEIKRCQFSGKTYQSFWGK